MKPKITDVRPAEVRRELDGETEDKEEDDYYFMDIQPPWKVAEHEEIPQSEGHTVEASELERNDDCLSQDTPASNSPGVEEELVETDTVAEKLQFSGSGDGSETEPMAKRQQRERRPPKTFIYDKIGSPSCYGLTALPFHTMH